MENIGKFGNKEGHSLKQFNPFQPSIAFHIETSHLFCRANQVTGFYIKHNTGLKWVKMYHTKFENQIISYDRKF